MTDPFTGFRPPRLLRSGHLQSLLGSSSLRRRVVEERARGLQAAAEVWTLDGGDDVRLQGLLSRQAADSRGLAVLLHGWEGNVNSNYMLGTGAGLFADGFDVFRLNFRDHGDTHHLNPGLFHSCRIGEVVHALRDLQDRYGAASWGLAGYSLGGNFSLRVGLRAVDAGLDIRRIVAICPVIDPARAMDAMESGLGIYERYFERKWRRSLLAKKACFPDLYGGETWHEIRSVRERTEHMARHHGFPNAAEYFDGYSIARDRLASLAVPATIMTAEDDPVVPSDDFHDLPPNPNIELLVTRYGGHCAYLKNWRFDSLAEDLMRERFVAKD